MNPKKPDFTKARERGSGFVAIRAFVRQRFGSEGEKKLFENLSSEVKNTYEHALAHGWYPTEHSRIILDAIVDVFGEDSSLAFDIGVLQARQDVKGIVKFLVLFATPHQLVKRAAKVWSQHLDEGWMEYEKITNNSCDIVLHDFFNGKLNCHMAAGNMSELARFTGARNVKIEETECIGDGAAVCRWKITWE